MYIKFANNNLPFFIKILNNVIKIYFTHFLFKLFIEPGGIRTPDHMVRSHVL